VRTGLDGTPLLGARTGIGRYVQALLDYWPHGADRPIVTAFTLRGGRHLAQEVPDGVTTRWRPLPARLVQRAWQVADWPPVQWASGPVDVFHGTNFVLPPTGRAAGVLTVHDLSFLRTPSTVSAASARYRTLVPVSLRRAAVVCTPSSAVAEEVVAEYGLDPSTVRPTPLGVAPAWFDTTPPAASWLAAQGLPSEYFLCVGALEPRKGIGTAARAHRLARAVEPDLPPLVHVGPPGWGPDLDADEAAELVRAGYRSESELRRLVAGATALVFPSRYEGFGLPPLEALATGTAVLASDLPVVREVTADQAVLLPPDDVDAWAEAMLAAAGTSRDPGAAERRRAQARRFTWADCALQTARAYELARSARV
jgi:glycosyltransferase involved in cell wall biosynthesis